MCPTLRTYKPKAWRFVIGSNFVNKSSAIADIARIFLVIPDHGVVENAILDADDVEFYYDVVVSQSERSSWTVWYQA